MVIRHVSVIKKLPIFTAGSPAVNAIGKNTVSAAVFINDIAIFIVMIPDRRIAFINSVRNILQHISQAHRLRRDSFFFGSRAWDFAQNCLLRAKALGVLCCFCFFFSAAAQQKQETQQKITILFHPYTLRKK